MCIDLILSLEKLIPILNFLQLLELPASIAFIILNNTAKIFFWFSLLGARNELTKGTVNFLSCWAPKSLNYLVLRKSYKIFFFLLSLYQAGVLRNVTEMKYTLKRLLRLFHESFNNIFRLTTPKVELNVCRKCWICFLEVF